MRRLLPALLVIPALALSACGEDIPGDSVAKVGDESITRDTFDRWITIAAKSQASQTGGSSKGVCATFVAS